MHHIVGLGSERITGLGMRTKHLAAPVLRTVAAVAGLACAGMVVASAAGAQSRSDEQACVNGQDDRVVISSCSRLLASGISDPHNKAITYYNRGLAYFRGKQYERAASDYSQAIRLNPTMATAVYNRAVAYHHMKRYRLAIADYSSTIGLNNKASLAYYSRGLAYSAIKDYSSAIADYDRALQMNPKADPVYYVRGVAYVGLKQYGKAISDFTRAINISGQPNYYGKRALAHYRRGDVHEAIKDYNEAIQLKPSEANFYVQRGRSYFKLKQYGRSIRDYDQAIKIDPQHNQAYVARGVAYEKLGRQARALRDFKRAVALKKAKLRKLRTDKN
jgi:tetratricopeptide (TPR) repeat protein